MSNGTTRAWTRRPRGWQLLLASTLGKKIIMGVTGLMMVGWLFIHMAGNTLLFSGPEPMNWYGWFLQEGSHGVIWVVRAVMLGAISLHVWAAISLTRANRAARPERYRKGLQRKRTTLAAMTMRVGGVVLLAFIVFHIAHLTFGAAHPDFEHLKPYENATIGLKVVPVAVFYIVAQLALGLHLFHGVWSGLQTLGFDHPQYSAHRKGLATLLALAIAGMNIVFVVYILGVVP